MTGNLGRASGALAMELTSLPVAQQMHSDSLVDLRQDFHKHTELKFREHRTATVIAERLAGHDL